MVEKLKENEDVEVVWLPFFLRPDTPPEGMELPAYIREKSAEVNQRLRKMASAYGMQMAPLNRILNTRSAHEATEYARAHGAGEAFHRVVFRQVYADRLDISRWEVLRAAAEEVGLDATEMQAEVESGKYRQMVQDLVDEAYALGVTVVPTYVFNDRYAMVGAQPYSVFEQVVAKLSDGSEEDADAEEEL